MKLLKKPYLVQLALIRKPLGIHSKDRLGHALCMDYMGSAEFEFGAIPEAYRVIKANIVDFKLTLVPDLLEGEIPLRVYHALNDEDFATYSDYIRSFRNHKTCNISTKERVKFDPQEPGYADNDFWWDIRNQVMWSFNKIFMNRLPEHVQASIDYINEVEGARLVHPLSL